jgi:hypothetical protein
MSNLKLSPALVTGGAGAADYAASVFGGPGQQQASGLGNVIAAKAVSCSSGGSRKQGKKSKRQQQQQQQEQQQQQQPLVEGGVAVTELAVPVVLTAAQQYSLGRSRKQTKGGKQTGLTELAVPVVLTAAQQMYTKRRRSGRSGSKKYRGSRRRSFRKRR